MTLVSKQEIINIKEEILELEQCYKLALSIASNNKGECLLKALDVSFKNTVCCFDGQLTDIYIQLT